MKFGNDKEKMKGGDKPNPFKKAEGGDKPNPFATDDKPEVEMDAPESPELDTDKPSIDMEGMGDEQWPPDLDEYFKELSAEEIQQIRDSEQEKLYIIVDEDTHYIRSFIPDIDDEADIKEKGGFIMTQEKFLELYDSSEAVKSEEIKESLAQMLASMIRGDNQKSVQHLSTYLEDKSAQILRKRLKQK